MTRRDGLSRRRALASLAAGSVAALAGCTYERDVNYEDTPDPVEQEYPIEHLLPDLPVHEHVEDVEAGVEAGIEAGTEADATDEDGFAAALEELEVAVDSLEREGRFLYLEYTADSPETGLLYDVGLVAGAFVPYANEGDDPARLEATLLEFEGDPFGVFDVLVKWAQEYEADELPLASYAELVMGTLKTKREFEQQNEDEEP